MKKLVLFFAMAAVVTFGACTPKAQQETTTPEPEQTEAPAPGEEAPIDSTATPAPAETPAQ